MAGRLVGNPFYQSSISSSFYLQEARFLTDVTKETGDLVYGRYFDGLMASELLTPLADPPDHVSNVPVGFRR